jgi:5,10-methylenetetrahydrofolate reductase
MAPHPCAFLDLAYPPPVTPVPARPLPDVPLVLTDLSVPPSDRQSLTATARRLAGSCDALLVGDHQDRPDFAPTVLARLIADAGSRPWVTLACRDRPRAALELELDGLRDDNLATVLCVTGDGRAPGVEPSVPQVFDLDGIRLAGLAAARGLPVAVPETPAAPPLALRPERLVRKQQVGASVAVLNHVGRPDRVATFVAAARARGLVIPVVASVAVYTDERSAAVLIGLPGLELDAATVAAVLAADDPVAAGIDAAVAEAETLLAIDGVAGVNLSGLASERSTAFAADVQAEVGQRVRAGQAARRG